MSKTHKVLSYGPGAGTKVFGIELAKRHLRNVISLDQSSALSVSLESLMHESVRFGDDPERFRLVIGESLSNWVWLAVNWIVGAKKDRPISQFGPTVIGDFKAPFQLRRGLPNGRTFRSGRWLVG